MSIGDIFKGAANAAAGVVLGGGTGAKVGLDTASEWTGEKLLGWGNRGRGDPQGHRDTGAGVVAQRGNPANQFNARAENATLTIGEKYGEGVQQKASAIMGGAKAAKFVLTHDPRTTGKVIKTAGQTMWEHPELVRAAAIEGISQAGIQSLMDPTTYLSAAPVALAGVGEHIAQRTAQRTAETMAEETAARIAARTAETTAERTGERVAVKTADEVAQEAASPFAGAAARSAAPEGLKEGLTATARRGPTTSTRIGRGLERIDVADANLRESFTGNPVGKLGQRRIDLGERIFPGAQTSIPRTFAKDMIQSSPTMPSEGAALAFRQAKWRVGQVTRRMALPGEVHSAERVGQLLDNPRAALTDPKFQGYAHQAADWAVREHPEAVAAVGAAVAASKAGGIFNALQGLTSGAEGAGAEKATSTSNQQQAYEPLVQPGMSIRPTGFVAPQTAARKLSSRVVPGKITTVEDSPMTPTGPKNWFGPQGGYSAGRGFEPVGSVPGTSLGTHSATGAVI